MDPHLHQFFGNPISRQIEQFPETLAVTQEEDEAWQSQQKAVATGVTDGTIGRDDRLDAATYIKAIGPDIYTGGSVDYYSVEIMNPTSGSDPYIAECNDIIEALGMSYAQGNIFKAVWRMCAAENLGKSKRGYEDGLYDAEKIVFFGEREVVKRK